ncbi:hypothetical protein, partial [Klebsiella aerogenes]|uniref:hypothetical protein n=1 Tax=Klebsiella aerogenes TaxID=548 RepID=UPI001D0DD46D
SGALPSHLLELEEPLNLNAVALVLVVFGVALEVVNVYGGEAANEEFEFLFGENANEPLSHGSRLMRCYSVEI